MKLVYVITLATLTFSLRSAAATPEADKISLNVEITKFTAMENESHTTLVCKILDVKVAVPHLKQGETSMPTQIATCNTTFAGKKEQIIVWAGRAFLPTTDIKEQPYNSDTLVVSYEVGSISSNTWVSRSEGQKGAIHVITETPLMSYTDQGNTTLESFRINLDINDQEH